MPKKNFCTECCESKIDPIYKNVVHVCTKTCFKATIASSNNDEYKNVCINSPDSSKNIFGYCENKLNDFSEIQKDACKLDMCNLCCVTMDSIKSKNFSVDSLKRCYNDCSEAYNNTASTEVKEDKNEECKQKNANHKDLTASENFGDLASIKDILGLSESQEKTDSPKNDEITKLSEQLK